MSCERILVVDDSELLADITATMLESQGFVVDVAYDPASAINFIDDNDYACVVSDIEMGRVSGYDLCEAIRRNLSIPVLFLSTLNDEESICHGFDVGGDGFMVKPAGGNELCSRVRSLIRRHRLRSVKSAYGIAIDTNSMEVLVDGSPVSLTKREYLILNVLIDNAGKPVSRWTLVNKVWGLESPTDDTLRVHMSHIRKKIGNAMIFFIPSKGYMLTRS